MMLGTVRPAPAHSVDLRRQSGGSNQSLGSEAFIGTDLARGSLAAARPNFPMVLGLRGKEIISFRIRKFVHE